MKKVIYIFLKRKKQQKPIVKDKSVICRAARVNGKSHGYYWEYEKE